MDGWVVALDAGGSSVKSGLVGADGRWIGLPTEPMDASGAASAIVEQLGAVVGRGVRASAGTVLGIGIAIPGPFDYARGISLMTHKYAGIKGVPLADALRDACGDVGSLPIWFMHDANAFLAGERWRGAARGCRCCIGVTLGTGVGVACWENGAFVSNSLGSPSPEVSVWSRPFQGGLVEDAISTRGLVDRYHQECARYPVESGVKGIAEAALRGDAAARRLFSELGDDLGAVLAPLCERFRPERVVLGGQIANAFDLFAPVLGDALARAARGPVAVRGVLGEAAALCGVASRFFCTGR